MPYSPLQVHIASVQSRFLIAAVIVVFGSCQSSTPKDSTASTLQYSFFVAGHTYGNATDFQYGLHPPFVDQIPYVNDYPRMELGVLTGDVVPRKTQAYWDSARVDIEKFAFPVHIAAGNHDRGSVFESFYPYYYSFKHESDLFIILSPTDWNIEGEQKEFLQQTLDSNAAQVGNIFIFSHELIWWSPEKEFKNIEINYRPHYPGSTNYWTEISPILTSLSNNVVVFAGDLGATAKIAPYMYHQYDNVSLIASGMGGGKQDNFIVVEVGNDGSLTYKVLGIDGESPVELGKLEDYQLP